MTEILETNNAQVDVQTRYSDFPMPKKSIVMHLSQQDKLEPRNIKMGQQSVFQLNGAKVSFSEAENALIWKSHNKEYDNQKLAFELTFRLPYASLDQSTKDSLQSYTESPHFRSKAFYESFGTHYVEQFQQVAQFKFFAYDFHHDEAKMIAAILSDICESRECDSIRSGEYLGLNFMPLTKPGHDMPTWMLCFNANNSSKTIEEDTNCLIEKDRLSAAYNRPESENNYLTSHDGYNGHPYESWLVPEHSTRFLVGVIAAIIYGAALYAVICPVHYHSWACHKPVVEELQPFPPVLFQTVYLTFLNAHFAHSPLHEYETGKFGLNEKFAAKLDFYDIQCADVKITPNSLANPRVPDPDDKNNTIMLNLFNAIPTGVDHIQDGGREVCTFYMYDVVASTIASAVKKAFPKLITQEYAKPTRSVAAELDIEGSSQELLPEHAEL